MVNNLFEILKSKNSDKGITFINPKEEFLSYKDLYINSLKLLSFFNFKGLKWNY